MICETCRIDAEYNRDMYNQGKRQDPHNDNYECYCGCQHELAGAWESQFSTEEPRRG